MAVPNHYDTLGLHPEATQAQIKQAYRRLVKLFHPDSNPTAGAHDQIAQINVAYEVLGDPHHRQSYDWQLHDQWQARESVRQRGHTTRHQRTAAAQKHYQAQQPTGQQIDEHLQLWLQQVYSPVNQLVRSILEPLQEQLDELAADPFDDELMEAFQIYLTACRQQLEQACAAFQSLPNPANVAGVAAHLYYCLNQVGDGIEELEYFTLNYDDHYLHTGQELFRIAMNLRWEAEHAIKNIS
ncbi:MAG TPA: DnaJ domain-containing protein [Candidatus Caenarcaniphilales bacterium]